MLRKGYGEEKKRGKVGGGGGGGSLPKFIKDWKSGGVANDEAWRMENGEWRMERPIWTYGTSV